MINTLTSEGDIFNGREYYRTIREEGVIVVMVVVVVVVVVVVGVLFDTELL
jgi:hypothetical protein